MADLYAGRGTDPDEMYRQMKERMEAEGLPYGKRTHTYNSRKAQELGKWADTQDNGDALHDALYRAYFVDTKNIGDIDVLVEIADAMVSMGRKFVRFSNTASLVLLLMRIGPSHALMV